MAAGGQPDQLRGTARLRSICADHDSSHGLLMFLLLHPAPDIDCQEPGRGAPVTRGPCSVPALADMPLSCLSENIWSRRLDHASIRVWGFSLERACRTDKPGQRKVKRPRLFWWTRTGVVLAGIVMANACASIAPMRDVRPEPDFISAAVQPEDKVAVSTVDGRELEFEVASVEADAIVSADGRRVYFRDIDAIAIRSWEEPAHPCGGGTPVGCSVPEVISAASTYHDRDKDVIH